MSRKDAKSSKARRRKRPVRSSEDFRELPLWPEKVQGTKYVRQLERLIDELRETEAHGNRELFLDQVLIAHLLAFFNSTIRSLRQIEDFSKTQQAQRVLATRRISKSTLSDYHQLADAERLKPIIGHLRSAIQRRHAGRPLPQDLEVLGREILAVDGTFFNAAADVAWAIGHRNQHTTAHRARLDVQLNVASWLPQVIAVPEPGEGEAEAAAKWVQPQAIHLYDRGYNSFALIAAHYDTNGPEWTARAEFVMRAKQFHMRFRALEERPLSPEQQAEGVISDRIGQLRGSRNHAPPPVTLREIILRSPDGDEVRLLTNLLEVPAAIIGLLYFYRWQVELFFRWLKCYAHFDHLISHSRQGVLLQFYVIILGVLLMYLHTGGRPSLYTFTLLGLVARGQATLEEIIPILRERERRCELDRQSAAKRRARKRAQAR